MTHKQNHKNKNKEEKQLYGFNKALYCKIKKKKRGTNLLLIMGREKID